MPRCCSRLTWDPTDVGGADGLGLSCGEDIYRLIKKPLWCAVLMRGVRGTVNTILTFPVKVEGTFEIVS